MNKKIFTFINCTVVIILIGIIALITVVGIKSNAEEIVQANYMTSQNLSKDAKVTGDMFFKSKINDGKNNTVSTFSKRKDAEIVIDLKKEQPINSIVLKEDGLNCKSFDISISNDDNVYNVVHKGDKIEFHRLCTFSEVNARYVKIAIREASDNVSLKEVEIYNEAKRNSSAFRVSGYYACQAEWAAAYFNATTVEEKTTVIDKLIVDSNMDNLTHLYMYCGVTYNAEGDVFINADPIENEKQIEVLKFILSRLKANSKQNIQLLNTFGANSGNETFLTAIGTNKKAFITNLIEFSNETGFDGIDFDYEFPVTKNDFATFDAFLIDLKARMVTEMDVKENALLSCAFGTRDINYSKEAVEAIDFVNCMTYDIFDQDGEHSSFWGGCVQGGVYLQSVGFKKEQINIGIPFYGTQQDALMEQYLWLNVPNPDYYQNVYTIIDYTGVPTQVYFNSPSMARDKTAFALLAGYGGIMTWHSTIDFPVSHEMSLWKAINSAVTDFGGAL